MKLLNSCLSVFSLLLISCWETPSEQTIETQIIIPGEDQTVSMPIEKVEPLPTEQQLNWQEAEMGMFIHYSMHTYTNKEWGDGNEPPETFNPSNLDVRQWVSLAKDAGFKYAVLTAKHNDGFCLWPSKYTKHSIKYSPYLNGRGDIIKQFSEACKEFGINFSFYISPWDNHEPTYGTQEYENFFVNQLRELLTNYGPVYEVWLDGGGNFGLNGEIVDYDWQKFYSCIRTYQPKALIAAKGPDIGWIGNELGIGNDTQWSYIWRELLFHGNDRLWVWFPYETDVSIRPGWFYHPEENDKVRSVANLVNLYFNSVGKNSNLLLNIPPTKEGIISDIDERNVRAFAAELKKLFSNDLFYKKSVSANFTREGYSPSSCLDNNKKTFWVTPNGVNQGEIIIDLGKEETLNVLRLEEPLQFGQRVSSFEIEALVNGTWKNISVGTTIGHARMFRLPQPITCSKVKVKIINSRAAPAIRTISAYFYSMLDY